MLATLEHSRVSVFAMLGANGSTTAPPLDLFVEWSHLPFELGDATARVPPDGARAVRRGEGERSRVRVTDFFAHSGVFDTVL